MNVTEHIQELIKWFSDRNIHFDSATLSYEGARGNLLRESCVIYILKVFASASLCFGAFRGRIIKFLSAEIAWQAFLFNETEKQR